MAVNINEVWALRNDLRRIAMRILGKDHGMAEDFVQDVMVRAMAKSHLYKEDTNLKGWLVTILRNDILTYVRRSKLSRIVQSETSDASEIEVPILPSQEISIQWKEFGEVFAKLGEDQKRSLQLICIEGRTYEEVAEMENVPIGTIKSRVGRARAILRESMELPDPDNVSLGVLSNDNHFRPDYS